MKKNLNRSLLLSAGILIAISGCQKAASVTSSPPVPTDWMIHTYDEREQNEESAVSEPGEAFDRQVDAILGAQADSLEEGIPANEEPSVLDRFGTKVAEGPGPADASVSVPDDAEKSRPADWAPWRAEYFLTDLGVTLSGWVGALISKGTPSVTLVWRKGGRDKSAPETLSRIDPNSETIAFDSETTLEQIDASLDGIVKAALSARGVRDEAQFRKNLRDSVLGFQSLASVLDREGGGPWWVSRFRVDAAVEASGMINPVISVGAEVRVRLEWHRLMRKSKNRLLGKPRLGGWASPELAKNLRAFAEAISGDLDVASRSPALTRAGFEAHSFRVGLGATVKGEIGIGKASASTVGHLYFSRNAKKPPVGPAKDVDTEESEPLALISEGDPAMKGATSVVPVDRRVFRRGLNRALKIGGFFASRASRLSTHRWKVYELKSGFDISYGGKTGIVPVTGLATMEIGFYNQRF